MHLHREDEYASLNVDIIYKRKRLSSDRYVTLVNGCFWVFFVQKYSRDAANAHYSR
jgi:hypothetical protein